MAFITETYIPGTDSICSRDAYLAQSAPHRRPCGFQDRYHLRNHFTVTGYFFILFPWIDSDGHSLAEDSSSDYLTCRPFGLRDEPSHLTTHSPIGGLAMHRWRKGILLRPVQSQRRPI